MWANTASASTGGPASVTDAAAATAPLKIAVAADVTVGSYPLTVQATSGALTQEATFTLTVTAAAPPAPTVEIYVADLGNHRIVRMDDISGAGWVAYGT